MNNTKYSYDSIYMIMQRCHTKFLNIIMPILFDARFIYLRISGRVKGIKLVPLVTLAWLVTMFHHVRERGYKINLLDIIA